MTISFREVRKLTLGEISFQSKKLISVLQGYNQPFPILRRFEFVQYILSLV